jgi:hypothetical protein
MSTDRDFGVLAGVLFFLASLPALIGAWRYSVKRVRAYSHQYAHHKARRFPLGPQLRYVAEKARDLGDGAWMYSTSW